MKTDAYTLELVEYVKDFLRWRPMAVLLRYAWVIGLVYLWWVAVLIDRGDLVLEVWFLPW